MWLLAFALMSAPATSAPQDYQEWIRPYRDGPLRGWFGDAPGEVRLRITAIEGDAPKPVPQKGPVRMLAGLGYSIKYGSVVSTEGRVSHFSHTATNIRNSGFSQISAADQQSLKALLQSLPDDFGRLPPPDRRLVLQVPSPEGIVARVYDRANAPQQVLEILRLARSTISSFVLKLKAEEEWKIGHHSAFTATPDGKTLITAGQSGSFRFWDADSRAMLRDVPGTLMPIGAGWNFSAGTATRLSVSPDGFLMVVEGDYKADLRETATLRGYYRFQEWENERTEYELFHPQFTQDGRYLLIPSSRPALIAFDTRTKERVTAIPGLPPEALAWFPLPRGERSLYMTAAGEVALWSGAQKRQIAVLDPEGRIDRIAFSPDESMVSAVTFHNASGSARRSYRLRVWRTDDGALVHELRSLERSMRLVKGLLWTPDGKYVLAAIRQDDFSNTVNVGVWSMATGRHRGELTGCHRGISGLVLLPSGRLLAGCSDGVVREWSLPEVIEQVSAFEATLPQQARTASEPAR